MALELSTIGVTVKYKVEDTAGTRPTENYVLIPGIKSTPDMNGDVTTLDVTALDDTSYHRYIAGLKDAGGDSTFTANMTTALLAAWNTCVSAYTTAAAENKSMWFEINVPGLKTTSGSTTTDCSFFFSGMPVAVGMNAMEVDAVAEVDLHIIPNKIEGWAAKSTTNP